MKITSVHVNHEERNYFDDYSEIRSDDMIGVTDEKVSKAIDKLQRRYRRCGICDCMFVSYSDGTAYRLMYGYDESNFNPATSSKELRLRHYTNYQYGSCDVEKVVTPSEAKRMILGLQND